MSQQSDAVLYELARDLISGHMALLSGQLWQERSKDDHDDALCAQIQSQNTRLFLERESLSCSDRASLVACIYTYARSTDGAEVAISAIDEFHRGMEQ